MANSAARGSPASRKKQDSARGGTKSGTRKSQVNMQADSGGRGGHRTRKGGRPEGS
jgi:hypothetical protein